MDQSTPRPGIQQIFTTIFLVFLALTLPGADWSLFGWLHALLPLGVFALLAHYGVTVGGKFVLAGLIMAVVVGVVVPPLSIPLFALSMVPVGYVLAISGSAADSPVRAGTKGIVTLLVSWLLLIGAAGVFTGHSPYSAFTMTLNSAIDETLGYYRTSGSLAPDAMMMLETTLQQMRIVLPIILPSLIAGSAVFVVWLTMVAGNRLAARLYSRTIWPLFRYWQLPDRLIWLAIGCAVPAVIPGVARYMAINLLIVLSAIYCLQGLAICVFFLNKWKAPPLFRSFIYVMIIFQSFGTLVLLIAGVADVWLDLRKLQPKAPVPRDSE
ncbi:MAG: DUF2232 domain-containing protein [Desulfopila sp.]